MKRLDSQPITREALYDLYVVQGMKAVGVARVLRRRNGDILRALSEHGFLTKVSKEWMEQHYVRDGLSVEDVAALLQCGEANVRKYLRSFGIPIRYRSRGRQQIPKLNDPHWLYQQYVEQGRSLHEIADDLLCSVSSLVRALMRFSITREHSERPYRMHAHQRYFTQKQRRAIFTRDGFRCLFCGTSESLEAHHIIPIAKGGTNALENGATLCVSCHDTVQGNEAEFVATFQSLVQGLPT